MLGCIAGYVIQRLREKCFEGKMKNKRRLGWDAHLEDALFSLVIVLVGAFAVFIVISFCTSLGD